MLATQSLMELWFTRLLCPWYSQARVLEQVAISFSSGFFWPRDWTWVSRIAGRFLPSWAAQEASASIKLTPLPPPLSPYTTFLLSVSMILTILDISPEWNCTGFVILWLASSTSMLYHVKKFPCVHGWTVFHSICTISDTHISHLLFFF